MGDDLLRRAEVLARRLAVLSDGNMRLRGVAEALEKDPPLASAWTLEGLIRGALGKQRDHATVYACMVDPRRLVAILGETRVEQMCAEGLGAGCIAAVQWLSSRHLMVADEASRVVAGAQLLHRDLRQVSLGDRRALARRARGEMLKKLLLDPDPFVIDNLLHNPRTTQQAVLRICARRPTVSPPLEAVMRSPRWGVRYDVRLALARNPHLLAGLAVGLLVTLQLPDIASIRGDATLSPPLRLAAQRLLDIAAAPEMALAINPS